VGGEERQCCPFLSSLPHLPAPQVMKTMGLNNAVHWVAWFITGFVQLSISVTALTAILKYGQVLMHSHVLIIWLFLAVYAVATIMFW
jgi:ATP-binding cassette subfamily A (ABC1) protein 2